MGAIGSPTEAANREAVPVTKLIRMGGKLALLGVLAGPADNTTMRWWHVARHGTVGARDALTGLAYATSLCRRNIVTNGYCSDFTPPTGSLCPACHEQL